MLGGFTSWGQFIAMLLRFGWGNAKLRENLWRIGCQRGETSSSGVASTALSFHLNTPMNNIGILAAAAHRVEQLLAKCQILVASQPETRKKRKFRFGILC